MTCEIAIMNSQAAVLAADSATTVTQWVQGNMEERYFKGANKIFQLSSYHPVGMMIYASSNLQGVPWEVVAKDFREHLHQKSFKNLDGYSNELIDYCQNHDKLFPEDVQRATFLSDGIRAATIYLYSNIVNDESVMGADSDDSRATAIREIITAEKDKIDLEDFSNNFEQNDLDRALDLYADELAEALAEYYKHDNNAKGVDCSQWAELSISLLVKQYSTYIEKTGVVIAGFGDDDYFPSFREYSCYGLLLGKFVCDEVDTQRVDRVLPAVIKPFATIDMVNTFVYGISQDVFGLVQGETRKAMKALVDSLSASHDIDFGSDLDETIEKVLGNHASAWMHSAMTKNTDPLRRVVGSLPVDEMAELAETLVMLESLKEKVTKPTESVGGPIDVCVISKSDGFVWVKRKRYFDPDLNPSHSRRQTAKFNLHNPDSMEG